MSNDLPELPVGEPQLMYTPQDEFWSGYPGETKEGMQLLRNITGTMPYSFDDEHLSLPSRVDVREDEMFTKSWMRVENQGGVGACQGYGLIHCVEYLYAVLTGQIVQLSPMYAYLLSQFFDGIRGDRGSTLSGGTKALMQMKLCLLSEYPRERSYPSNGYKDIPQSAIDAAKAGPFQTVRTVRFRDAGESRAFIGSMAGIIQTGTAWPEQMARVPRHGAIQGIGGRNFGGHSYNICGYKPIDELSSETRAALPRTRGTSVHIVTNSHSRSWAADGWAYLTDELFNALNTKDLLLGRTDMGDIKPRPSRRDFTTRQHTRFTKNDK